MTAAGSALERVPTGSLCASYLQAQLDGNRREALRLIEDGLKRGLTSLDIHKVLQTAQSEIGRLWQEDRITIAQEHMATAISQVVLSHVYQYADPQRSNGKRVLVACVEGELHDFPARLGADALDLAGFEVRYLGASVPHESLVAMVYAHLPHLLVLSVTMTFNVPSLREAVRRVRARQSSVPIAVGGGACIWQPGLAGEVGADVEGSDAAELVAKAEQLLGVAA